MTKNFHCCMTFSDYVNQEISLRELNDETEEYASNAVNIASYLDKAISSNSLISKYRTNINTLTMELSNLDGKSYDKKINQDLISIFSYLKKTNIKQQPISLSVFGNEINFFNSIQERIEYRRKIFGRCIYNVKKTLEDNHRHFCLR